jgi:hypothetical protein
MIFIAVDQQDNVPKKLRRGTTQRKANRSKDAPTALEDVSKVSGPGVLPRLLSTKFFQGLVAMGNCSFLGGIYALFLHLSVLQHPLSIRCWRHRRCNANSHTHQVKDRDFHDDCNTNRNTHTYTDAHCDHAENGALGRYHTDYSFHMYDPRSLAQ